MMTFDSSLSAFASLIVARLGEQALDDNVILRDVLGRLAFISRQELSADDRDAVSRQAVDTLGPYVDENLVVLTATELGEPSIFDQSRPVLVTVLSNDRFVNVVERRIVGRDWSSLPAPGWRAPNPARMVFWSLKGGVGRTTALCVAAVDLANRGNRVLALDLDLEAPGLASVMLSTDTLPRFGALDWYIENGMQELNDTFLESSIAPSDFPQGNGTVDVMPAIGAESHAHPENVIPKLGRAYIEDVTTDGTTQSFMAQTQELVDRVLMTNRYDVLLVDARAGLNETSAASLLGLGADVLMFGVNSPQTFDGYRYLLGYLRGLPVDPDDDWRYRLKMVHAKADSNLSGLSLFHDRSYGLFSEFLYEEERGTDERFNFGLDDPDAPHFPWVVVDDSNYRNFEPLKRGDQVSDRIYKATFGGLLDGIRERILAP